MPVTTAPSLIEQSDFSQGWTPGAEPAHFSPAALQESLNLIPSEVSKSLTTRKGFKRVLTLDSGYYIKHIFPYPSPDGGATARRLILAVTNEASTKLYQWVIGGASSLIGTVASGGDFWGTTIDGVFYGGTAGQPVFSWNGTTFTADAGAIASAKVFDDDLKLTTATATDFTTKYPKDYAFKEDTIVSYTYNSITRYFKFIKTPDHRYKNWEKDKKYQRGNLVSRRKAWSGGATYMVSFRCIKQHISDDNETTPVNAPGTGESWRQYWRKVTTPAPIDDEGKLRSRVWAWVPPPARTSLGVFHGQRLWLRADDGNNYSTLQYSGILKYEEMGTKPTTFGYTSQLDFNLPTAFATGESLRGGGGGSQPFGVGDGDAITALVSYNNYLLVFKRFSTWVLSGLDEANWTVRKLAEVGCVAQSAVTEHESLVYFVSDQGVFVTDGNAVQLVQGIERISSWMREKLEWDNNNFRFTLFSNAGLLWLSFPMYGKRRPTHSLAYYPPDGSWWLTDLRAQAAQNIGSGGSFKLYFSQPGTTDSTAKNTTHAWTVPASAPNTTSTATTGATTRTNLFTNPNFGGNLSTWSTERVTVVKTADAAKGSGFGYSVTKTANEDPGFVYQTFEDESTGTHTMSVFVRRADWQNNRVVNYNNFRLAVNDTALASNTHVYTYVGNGWYKVSASYTGSASSRTHGFQFLRRFTYHIDKAMCVGTATPPPSFDGDGGDNGQGEYETFGSHAVLYEYNHPDVRESPTDDGTGATATTNPIRWYARTAWFPFGTANQQRRIRRIWSTLRGLSDYTLRGYRDYRNSPPAFQLEVTPDSDKETQYIEGRVMPDCSSICLEVEGLGAPASMMGVAIQTEPRRFRYHVNDGSESTEVEDGLVTEDFDYLVI